jgi:hypothetical protein
MVSLEDGTYLEYHVNYTGSFNYMLAESKWFDGVTERISVGHKNLDNDETECAK